MFALCERWMARQDFAGSVQWIVVDDGAVPTQCTAGQEYVRVERQSQPKVVTRHNHTLGDNLRRALSLVRSPKVLVIEDDDYYGRHYLRTLAGLLDTANLVGESGSKYYRLDNWTFQHFDNGAFLHEAALARTGFRSSLLPWVERCCEGDSSVDSRIWKASAPKVLLAPSVSGLHVSIKNGPGRKGHTHSRRLAFSDMSCSKLLEWTRGDFEAVRAYQSLNPPKSVVLYTAATSHKGKLYSKLQSPIAEGICFTDTTKSLPRLWHRRDDGAAEFLEEHPGRLDLLSRLWKADPCQFFPDATHSIYVDASMRLMVQPETLIAMLEERWPGFEVVAVEHPHDKPDKPWTVADECCWVREQRYAPESEIARQSADYCAGGLGDLRAYQCGLLVRRHTPAVVELGELWWQELLRYGHRRDQPSFPVACRLAGLAVNAVSHKERAKRMTRWFGHATERARY